MKPRGPTRRRTFNVRLIKRDSTYSVEQVTDLFAVHANTVRNWQADGLKAIDHHRPTLFHGSDLAGFLRRMMASRKQSCRPDEFFCFKCRAPRRPVDLLVRFELQGSNVLRMTCLCDCGTRMFKAGSLKNLSNYAEIFVLSPMSPEHMTVCDVPAVDCDLKEDETKS